MTVLKKWMIALGIIIACLFLYYTLPVLMPFIIGALFAYLGDPIVNWLGRHKVSRTLGVIIVFVVFLLIITLLLFILVPMLERQVNYFINKLPLIIHWIQNVLLPWLQHKFGSMASLNFSANKLSLAKTLKPSASVLTLIINTITQSGLTIIAWGANLLLIPVVAFYLMRDWKKVVAAVQSMLPRSIEPILMRLAQESNEVLGAFLRGQLLVMICLGCIYSVGLWIVGLQLALLIGMLAGLASVVPYLGFVVGIVAAAIAAYFQFHTAWSLLYVLIVFMIGQAMESTVLTPLFVGDRIGLHPVAVIFAVLAGGQLFGFVGVLIALPVAAVIMVFLRYFMQSYVASEFYQELADKPSSKT